MNRAEIGHNRPVSQRLHPFVYKAIVGLALVFVLAVSEFAGDSYAGYLIVVVAGLVFVALALPYVLPRDRGGPHPAPAGRDSGTASARRSGLAGWRQACKRDRCLRHPPSPSARVAFPAGRCVARFTDGRLAPLVDRGRSRLSQEYRAGGLFSLHERWLHAAVPMRFSPVLP